ncbi:DNA-directed RNA polymerase subunit N [Candidatus Micrarchaeota archaeon]|nr:DNA-directed RNA polymerase subunit N [Candidatus Micrarchaeota archaeon]
MLIPVRCFTCGKPVAEWFDEFKKRTRSHEEGGQAEDTAVVLDELGFQRYCCRRMMLSQVDLIDEIMPYRRF